MRYSEYQTDSPTVPYPVLPLEYEGTINGVAVSAKGSLQEIYAQVGLPDPTGSYELDVNEVNADLVPRGSIVR